jgi:hypothetical protein
MAKFAASVVDTSGKFAVGVVDTGMGYSGAGGKLIHEKNQKSKISWHCPNKARPIG